MWLRILDYLGIASVVYVDAKVEENKNELMRIQKNVANLTKELEGKMDRLGTK